MTSQDWGKLADLAELAVARNERGREPGERSTFMELWNEFCRCLREQEKVELGETESDRG